MFNGTPRRAQKRGNPSRWRQTAVQLLHSIGLRSPDGVQRQAGYRKTRLIFGHQPAMFLNHIVEELERITRLVHLVKRVDNHDSRHVLIE